MLKPDRLLYNNCIRLIIGIAALLISGCAATVVNSHPLIGKIVRAADEVTISETTIHSMIAAADVVYLGENHDNPWHHDLQLEIVRRLVRSGAKPAIGFEFFDTGQTADLTSFTHPVTHGNSSDKSSAKAERQLRSRLGWGKERDDEWAAYFPILDYARDNGLQIFGTDLPAGIRRRITRVGVSELSPVERRLVIDTGFRNDAYRMLMQDTFVQSHCGWSDQKLLDNLYQTWLARNDSMATAITDMLAFTEHRPVVMIVGSGHTMYNMGIYDRVAVLNTSARQINIGLEPVQDVDQPLADYLQAQQVGGAGFLSAHELFWFTPALKKDDPCVKFKQQLKTPPPTLGE
ncbi:MAG: ChaN family lipoprotein [Gammaproteobacteria bacterium]|nr:ChaN family lipoprotein [Gammaproteobacteria bacterium]MDH3465575.1 ChaN family lipoprotein [Gammaproteobacteria bacterium]